MLLQVYGATSAAPLAGFDERTPISPNCDHHCQRAGSWVVSEACMRTIMRQSVVMKGIGFADEQYAPPGKDRCNKTQDSMKPLFRTTGTSHIE